jgi:thiol-disulfide isomerase/thioredoxin
MCQALMANAQVKVGQKVPEVDFKSLLNTKQTNVSLSALQGKVILLDFWATWCEPCIKGMPHLEELQQTYKNKLQIITLTSENK